MPAWLPLAYALFAVLVAWGARSFRQKVWQQNYKTDENRMAMIQLF
jgi:hypothetical protein